MWLTEKNRKRINVRAENGIRRLRDKVPTRPLFMTTASGFFILWLEHVKHGWPLLPDQEAKRVA